MQMESLCVKGNALCAGSAHGAEAAGAAKRQDALRPSAGDCLLRVHARSWKPKLPLAMLQ